MAGGKSDPARRRGERREVESAVFLVVAQPPDSRIGERTQNIPVLMYERE